MTPATRRLSRLLKLTWVLLALAMPLAAQEDLPEGKGRVTLENTCTECHGLDKALKRLHTERQWREIAVRMRSKGATMSDDELNDLVAYLTQNFGDVEPKVRINQASAGEIQAALDLRPADCTAIVRYREEKGPFKEWGDLAKVKGLDRGKLESVKDRIAFQ